MSLEPAELARIEALIAEADWPAAVAALRGVFPKLTVTRCDPSDMGSESSYRDCGRWSLYLVDGTRHCWQLTADPARASGLVLVARTPASGNWAI